MIELSSRRTGWFRRWGNRSWSLRLSIWWSLTTTPIVAFLCCSYCHPDQTRRLLYWNSETIRFVWRDADSYRRTDSKLFTRIERERWDHRQKYSFVFGSSGFQRIPLEFAVVGSRSRSHRHGVDRGRYQTRNLGSPAKLSFGAILDAQSRKSLRGKLALNELSSSKCQALKLMSDDVVMT